MKSRDLDWLPLDPDKADYGVKFGAYWGTPGNVWCVWTRGGEAVIYVRARSKADAIQQIRAEAAEMAA